ncbi:MAG: hypothetical protein HQM03_11015 [Magnetococcales bacterium]|nr:hypothetical protein [Magnetococcales bacterium]
MAMQDSSLVMNGGNVPTVSGTARAAPWRASTYSVHNACYGKTLAMVDPREKRDLDQCQSWTIFFQRRAKFRLVDFFLSAGRQSMAEWLPWQGIVIKD